MHDGFVHTAGMAAIFIASIAAAFEVISSGLALVAVISAITASVYTAMAQRKKLKHYSKLGKDNDRTAVG